MPVDVNLLEARVVEILKTVYDPEIPVDIWELGLIYGIDVSPAGAVRIKMTLTAPNCPAAEDLPAEVRTKVAGLEGVTDAQVDIVFEPMWTKEMMSEAARLKLGFW